MAATASATLQESIAPRRLDLPSNSRPADASLPSNRAAASPVRRAVGPDSRLLSRMSHELRSPLNAVIGFSDLMHKEIHGPMGNDRYREYASHILTSGHELLRTAEDALALAAMVMARVDGAREVIEIAPLLQDVRRHLSQASIDRVRLVVDIDEGLAVIAQRRALRQTLWNLVKEAYRQCADGGLVNISAIAEGAQVTLRVSVDEMSACHGTMPNSDTEGSLSLSIADSLVGMLGGDLKVWQDGPRWIAAVRLECEADETSQQLSLPIG